MMSLFSVQRFAGLGIASPQATSVRIHQHDLPWPTTQVACTAHFSVRGRAVQVLEKIREGQPSCKVEGTQTPAKMRKHLKKILHRKQPSVEAGPSSAIPRRHETETPITGAPKDASYVPNIVKQESAAAGPSSAIPRRHKTETPITQAPKDASYVPNITVDPEAVYEIIDNSKWRKAFFIDGDLRWATQGGNGIGEKVSSDHSYNMRQIGDILYLAPIEAHEGTKDDVKAANDKRVEAYLDKITEKLVAQNTNVPPPTFETMRAFVSQNPSAIITLTTRDGILASDVHGYLDNDFDNPGPRLNKETQMTTRGHHSLMNREMESVFERLGNQLRRTLVSHANDPDDIAEGNEGDPGYESGGSEVSQDRCRESPAYALCDDDCWLKQASLIRSPILQSTHKLAKVSTLETTGIYTELERGFTRVLVIDPGMQGDQIRCTLEPMEILGVREQEEFPVERRLYEALSYTWGDGRKSRTIECNGKPFGVSQNLFEALMSIRLSDRRRIIWLDAISINQEDDAEKSEQVQHMYAIYRAATRVIVWLGIEADDSDFTMQAMAFVGGRKNRATIIRRDHNHECLVQLARVIKGIETLTRRPWFTRSWIRQEIAAAPKVIVRCASREVPWTVLKRSVNCLVRLRSKYVASRSLFMGSDDEFRGLIGPYMERSHALRFLKKDWVVGQSLLAEAGDLRSIWYYHTGGLLELLMAGRVYDATDARDKVYAILGMAEVPLKPPERNMRMIWAGDDKRVRPFMKVDYSASISEVYQYTAKYLINRDENLDILCILPTHRDAASGDLPSWTPDWRVPLSSRPLYDSWDYISYKMAASGFTDTEPQDQADLNRLVVAGFEVARIQQLLPLYPDNLPHPPESPAGSAIPFEEGKHIRRFAQSTRGPSIVPSTAVVGDAIWILYGCKMPVVLRPAAGMVNEKTFEVLGPSYVSTIMFGEAIEWLAEGRHDLDLGWIVLV